MAVVGAVQVIQIFTYDDRSGSEAVLHQTLILENTKGQLPTQTV
jgi:hypothetical protein